MRALIARAEAIGRAAQSRRLKQIAAGFRLRDIAVEIAAARAYAVRLAEGDPEFAWQWPEDEWQAISLNYTSGTTGNPKGVVYHHRGAYLNAIGNMQVWGMGPHPVYLWTLPMFHCNGWCFPWTIPALAGTHVCLRWVRAGANRSNLGEVMKGMIGMGGSAGKDMEGMDMSGGPGEMETKGADLKGARLRGVDLREAALRRRPVLPHQDQGRAVAVPGDRVEPVAAAEARDRLGARAGALARVSQHRARLVRAR